MPVMLQAVMRAGRIPESVARRRDLSPHEGALRAEGILLEMHARIRRVAALEGIAAPVLGKSGCGGQGQKQGQEAGQQVSHDVLPCMGFRFGVRFRIAGERLF